MKNTKTRAVERPVCSICDGDIDPQVGSGWRWGHNAQPVTDGRCCDLCNTTVVIPARIAGMIKRRPREDSK